MKLKEYCNKITGKGTVMNYGRERTWAEINLSTVESNFENMQRALSKGTKMLAVVKANAYGHGAVAIAKRMEGKEYIWGFAVATCEEALELREAGIKKPILILGYVFESDYEVLVDQEIRTAVFTMDMAEKLSRRAVEKGKILPVHFAVDTGMTRIGFRGPQESISEMMRIYNLPGLCVEGMFTHFARADEDNPDCTKKQFALFMEFVKLLRENGVEIPMLHCNNSAGILWHREGDLDMVRPGITIYGISPSREVMNQGVAYHPVLSWKTRISHIKEVEAGTQVSYGGTCETTGEKTVIATIPAGYADGYPRSLSNKGYVLVHGKKAPILGRVCMDQFMVDVTEIPGVKPHDLVTLVGTDGDSEITVDELAELSGRFPYEFLCCISNRVPRVFIG